MRLAHLYSATGECLAVAELPIDEELGVAELPALRQCVVKQLDSGFWYVRLGPEIFVQWPIGTCPAVDHVFHGDERHARIAEAVVEGLQTKRAVELTQCAIEAAQDEGAGLGRAIAAAGTSRRCGISRR